MMKEEKQETGLHSKVMIPKAEPLPLPAKRPVMPGRLDSKRKPKAQKTGSSAVNTSFLGQIIHGVVDGSFDAGYLLTVRVGDTDTILRGVVFEPGLCVPISEVNDIAPNVKLTNREKNVPFSEALHTSNVMTHGQHNQNTILPAPVPNAVAPSYFATLEKIGSERINMECCQKLASPSQSTSSVPVPNLPVASSLSVQNQMEPPANKGSDQTYMVALKLNAGPSTTTFISKADARSSSAAASEYEALKSVNLQGQMEFPAMIGAAKTDIVPEPGVISSKFTSCSQIVPVSIPIPDAVATSSVPVQTETKLSVTTKCGQKDMLTSPDMTASKSTSISEADAGFTSSMCKMDASTASSIHAHNQVGHPVSFGSCQIHTANPQPDPVPPKSSCTSMGVPVPSLISEVDTGFTSSMCKMDASAASSICAQNQMGHPVCMGSCQTDTMNPQPDPVPLKPPCTSMGVPIPSMLSDAYTPPITSACAEKMEPPTVTGSIQTDVMVPQGNVIPLMPLFVSQAVSCLPSTMLALDNLSKSSDNCLNQLAAPMMSSGQPDEAFSQHNTIPSKFMSISQDKPLSPIPMFVQYTQATSAVLQDQMESPVVIGSSQTGIVFPQSDVILPKIISVAKDSAHSDKIGHFGLSEQACDPIKVTETQMDVDKGA